MTKLVSIALTLTLIGCASKSIDVWLWSNAEVSDDVNENSTVQPHPCGSIEKKSLSVLPAEGKRGFEPGSELIVEHNGLGKIVRAWNAPMEPEVIAVEGNVIFLDYGNQALSIDAEGNLKMVGRRSMPREYVEDCPVRALGGEYSNFLCWDLTEEGSNNPRHFAYRIVCS